MKLLFSEKLYHDSLHKYNPETFIITVKSCRTESLFLPTMITTLWMVNLPNITLNSSFGVPHCTGCITRKDIHLTNTMLWYATTMGFKDNNLRHVILIPTNKSFYYFLCLQK